MAKKLNLSERVSAKKAKKVPESEVVLTVYEREMITLGHFIKYNLYLLAKAVVFNGLLGKVSATNPIDVAVMTNAVIDEIDLDTKQRKERSKEQKSEK